MCKKYLVIKCVVFMFENGSKKMILFDNVSIIGRKIVYI